MEWKTFVLLNKKYPQVPIIIIINIVISSHLNSSFISSSKLGREIEVLNQNQKQKLEKTHTHFSIFTLDTDVDETK